MDTQELERIMARYLRYERNCPILAIECPSRLATSYNNGGSADLLAVDNNRYLIEIELKTSIADLRADRKKSKHEYYRKIFGLPYKKTEKRFGYNFPTEPNVYPTHLFYYAVPQEISNEAKFICDELYPYAGLLHPQTTHYSNFDSVTVAVKKKAKAINTEKITVKQATLLAKSQSATLVRLLDVIDNYKNIKQPEVRTT